MTVLDGLCVKLISTSFIGFGNEKVSLVKTQRSLQVLCDFWLREKRNGFLRSSIPWLNSNVNRITVIPLTKYAVFCSFFFF